MKKSFLCLAAVFAVLFGVFVASCSSSADSPNLALFTQSSGGGSSDSGGGTQTTPTTPTPTPTVQQPTETAPTQPGQQPEETNPTTPATTPTDPSDPATTPDPVTPEPVSFSDVVELTTDNAVNTIPLLTSNVKKVIVTGEGSNNLILNIGTAIKSNTNISVELDLSEVSKVTYIGNDAFNGCVQLTKLTLPKSATSNAYRSFMNCTSLKEIVFPEGYKNIGKDSLNGLTSLEKLVLPSTVTGVSFTENEVYKNLKYVSTYDCVLLKNLNKDSAVETIILNKNLNSRSICYTNFKTLKSIILPDNIDTIGTTAFEGCVYLTNFVIPETVTSIRDKAFYACESLTSINIPSNVTFIGKEAFAGCKNANCEITLPNTLKTIGSGAFWGCEKIHGTLEIPTSVTTLGDHAFYVCGFSKVIVPARIKYVSNSCFGLNYSLTEVVLSEGIESIYGNAFVNCTSLVEITIPESVELFQSQIFKGCDKLNKVTVTNNSSYSWRLESDNSVVSFSNAYNNAKNFRNKYVNSTIYRK